MRGHLRKRGKNSWTIVLNLGRDAATGKRKQQWVSVKGTKRQAEAKLAELIQQVETGGYVRPQKMTVAEYLRHWLEDYAASHVRPTTLRRYAQIVEKHIIPALGSRPLTQLQPAEIQAAYSKAVTGGRLDGKEGGVSQKTLLQHHRVFSEALSHAVRLGLLARNPCKAIAAPRPERKGMTALNEGEVWALLDASEGTAYYPVFHLAVHTGLRRSELLGLRWKDVDLDFATLSVVQVLHRLKGGKILFAQPKTAKGRRVVDLTPESAICLREHRRRQEVIRGEMGLTLTDDDLVFSNLDGSPVPPDRVTKAFARYARKLGFPTTRFHDLRHTHASLMLKANVHAKIVSERLGHANIAITLDIYSHVVPGLQEAAAARFDEGLLRRLAATPTNDG